MKKKIVICGIVIIAVFCGYGLVFAYSPSQDGQYIQGVDTIAADETLIAEWIETIQMATSAMQYGPESVLEETSEIVDTEAEAEAVVSEYEVVLDEIFTEEEKAVCEGYHEGYVEAIEMYEESNVPPTSKFVGYGYFVTEVLSYTIEGNIATIDVLINNWAKSIDKCADGFKAVFIVNKSIDRIQLVNEDGIWKYADWDIVSPLLMDGDIELEKTFDTYEEAAEYANSVMPNNVLADEVVVAYK